MIWYRTILIFYFFLCQFGRLYFEKHLSHQSVLSNHWHKDVPNAFLCC